MATTRETPTQRRDREKAERAAKVEAFNAILPQRILNLLVLVSAFNSDAYTLKLDLNVKHHCQQGEDGSYTIVLKRGEDDSRDGQHFNSAKNQEWEFDQLEYFVKEAHDALREGRRKEARRKELLSSMTEEDKSILGVR